LVVVCPERQLDSYAVPGGDGFWITLLLASFSLFAPRNATVFVTLLVCALAISSAVFLILELDQPFGGLIQISSAPVRNALAQLGR